MDTQTGWRSHKPNLGRWVKIFTGVLRAMLQRLKYMMIFSLQMAYYINLFA
jgi:hypothetical protein